MHALLVEAQAEVFAGRLFEALIDRRDAPESLYTIAHELVVWLAQLDFECQRIAARYLIARRTATLSEIDARCNSLLLGFARVLSH